MAYRKLGRTSSQRKALLRDLTTAVIVNGRIETTEARAKETRRMVEKMITLGKRGDLHARRQAAKFIRDIQNQEIQGDEITEKTALQILFDDVAPRYENRNGGYTRIVKLDNRRGDAAPMVILELV